MCFVMTMLTLQLNIDLTEDGFIIFNDTDAQGDTEVGVISSGK